jgi:hypothetical protein
MTNLEKIREAWMDTYENQIDKTLKERGAVYGKFKHQAKCVGEIIASVENCAAANNMHITNEQRGSIAYIAIKLARFALQPHGDTSHDLHGYAKLIDELYNGKNDT